MKVSASILAIDNQDIETALQENRHLYDLVHVDIGDNIFCPTYGVPFEVINDLNISKDYDLDVHFMIERPIEILPRIENLEIYNISVHCESINVTNFKKFKSNNYKLGIAILVGTDLALLENYLQLADSVLLLCVKPGFSYQKPSVNPVDRVIEFQKLYPNYGGLLSVDGGVTMDMLDQLRDLNVDISVQGGAIFGS